MNRASAKIFAGLITAFALFAAAPASAQKLVTSVSSHRVLVNSSFTGAELVVFGTIEDAANTQIGKYDVVVTVRGPARWLVHPRNNGYHLTHHLLPAVPYYRLPSHGAVR